MKPHELDFFERLKESEKIAPSAPSEGGDVEKEMAKGDPDFSTPLTIRNIFTHHDTHPVVIDFALLKAFGTQWYTWEFETIFAEVQRLFQTQLSEHARAKIQCLKTVHVTDLPWTSWHVFEKIIQGFNNNVPRWDLMQTPTLEQLYAGIDILDQIRREEFSSEVRGYIAAAILNEDVFFVPPPLEFVQPEVAQPYYHCNDCGNEDSALFHDGFCDSCLSHFESDTLTPGLGKHVDYKVRFNPDPVESRWMDVRFKPAGEVKLEETQEDIQVAKLLVARDYMNVRRRQLAEQLVSLKSWLGSV